MRYIYSLFTSLPAIVRLPGVFLSSHLLLEYWIELVAMDILCQVYIPTSINLPTFQLWFKYLNERSFQNK